MPMVEYLASLPPPAPTDNDAKNKQKNTARSIDTRGAVRVCACNILRPPETAYTELGRHSTEDCLIVFSTADGNIDTTSTPVPQNDARIPMASPGLLYPQDHCAVIWT